MIKTFAAFGLVLMLAASAPAQGQQPAKTPMETLKKPLDEVIAILRDPQYRSKDKRALQRKSIYKVTDRIFDFVEISKRALARNWRIFTPAQRRDFTEVFTTLLKDTYSRKIQGEYTGHEKILYVSHEMLSATKAVVKTKILRESGNIPVDYRMHLRHGRWMVYDIKIEGVGLVQNYRAQFNNFLLNKKPADLIAQLRKKVAKFKDE